MRGPVRVDGCRAGRGSGRLMGATMAAMALVEVERYWKKRTHDYRK